jgi:hypothetical protein
MTDHQSTMAARCNRIKDLLGKMAMEGAEIELESARAQAEQMHDRVQGIGETGIAGDLTGRAAGELASLRAEASELSRKLDNLRSEAARLYRHTIGEQKDAFEKLSPVVQQQQSPEAYRLKLVFQQFSDCLNELDLFKASALDCEGTLERMQFQLKGTPYGDQADNVHISGTEDRPSLSP